MLIIIIATILVLGIAFYQVLQGLFSALIMAVLSVLCAAMAFGLYEPLASLLYTRQPGHADAASLVALFVVPLLALRLLFDRFIRSNVVFGMWVDRTAGGLLGLLTGMVLVGVLTVALQMLPVGASILGFRPFDENLRRDQRLLPFCPDQFTLGLAKAVSAGPLAGQRRFGDAHDDLLLELFCARNRLEMTVTDKDTGEKDDRRVGRVDATPNSLKVLGAYLAPEKRYAPWRKNVPDNPLVDPAVPTKIIIVRVAVDESAREGDSSGKARNWWLLPATHFRLRCEGKESSASHYPVGYLIHTPAGGWELMPAPTTNNNVPAMTKLVLARPLDKGRQTAEGKKAHRELVVDWVWRIPKDQQPKAVFFRLVAAADVVKLQQRMPPPADALDRYVSTRRRRR